MLVRRSLSSNLSGSTSLETLEPRQLLTGTPMNILPLGDSITYGYAAYEQAGYRGPLEDFFQSAGNGMSFVGTLDDLAGWDPFTGLDARGHFSVPGLTTTELEDALLTNNGQGTPALTVLANQAASPDAVLLHTGTNNFDPGLPTDNDVAAAELDSLLAYLRGITGLTPQTPIYLGAILPRSVGTANWNQADIDTLTNIAEYNYNAANSVTAFAGADLDTTLVDFYQIDINDLSTLTDAERALVNLDGDAYVDWVLNYDEADPLNPANLAATAGLNGALFADAEHPSALGYKIMAEVWYRALTGEAPPTQTGGTGSIEVGDLGGGVFAQDKTGKSGYILYSEESVHTRFPQAHFAGTPDAVADHLIVVKYLRGEWRIDDNNSYHIFTPRDSDVLLADIDFVADTITDLKGQDFEDRGINAGYADGDLEFFADQFGGVFNNGEFQVTGTFFTPNGGATDPQPGTLFFLPQGYTFNETDGTVTVSVLRTNGTAGEVSVDFSTVDATATAGQDYLATSGTVVFADGQNEAQITIELLTDTLVEPDELFNIALTNPAGGAELGADSVADVFLKDVPTLVPGQIPLGDLGGGVFGQDKANGIGYLLFTQQDVHTRFPQAEFAGYNDLVADNLILVKHIDGQWFIDDNDAYYLFTPADTDVLLAEIDFSNDIVTDLKGTESDINGIAAGYHDGDLVITTNVFGGSANPGEFELAGTYFIRNGQVPVPVGDLGEGVFADDNATGIGYLLFSEQDIFTRFPTAEFAGLSHRVADHLVVARLIDGQWFLDDNDTYIPFTPADGDVLLYQIDFDFGTLTNLEGVTGTIAGIELGYLLGDIEVIADQFGGEVAPGEFEVTGSAFVRNLSTEPKPGSFVFSPVTYNASETGGTISLTIQRTGGSDGQATVDYTTVDDTAIAGEDYTFAAGTLTFEDGETLKTITIDITNDLVDEPNEIFSVALSSPTGGATLGDSNTTADVTILDGSPIFVGDLAGGVFAQDKTRKTGYILYTGEPVQSRFPEGQFAGDPNAVADHFVVVKFHRGQWQIDDNNRYIPFTPRDSDILLASIDFVADTVTDLKGQDFEDRGIQAGYLDGDLEFFADQFEGVANDGEFQITGTFFLPHLPA